ncbi:hypothetical protein [Sandaracinus amylolyticus]|uniref:hypothetical protein n=1 Tax=Sandaracinus amylolyticus TaxID=927083 RepID=UPI001F23AF2C|nr:hypothetical protein [Sandaracinus amylolyticus]UJR80050.1 Hypothetical protein I5071_20940 [Sandaracinus amylolyticus]
MTIKKSPFERFDIDPRGGPVAITERLRELAEETTDADERAAIRAAWEELTLHPLRRLTAALDSFPESRAAMGPPPRRAPAREPDAPLDLPDLIARPRARAALPPPTDDERALLGPPAPTDPLGRR